MAKVSGINDAVFCHASGFIGGAGSYESALKMATISLEAEDEWNFEGKYAIDIHI